MVLGHEAAGTVVEVGVKSLASREAGDRVCMEPGIPDPNSKASRLGMYNIDPAVSFTEPAARSRANAGSCIPPTIRSSCLTM